MLPADAAKDSLRRIDDLLGVWRHPRQSFYQPRQGPPDLGG